MAMGKSITDEKGVTTAYHRITLSTQIFMDNQKQIQVTIASYTDQSFRQKEKDTGVSGLAVGTKMITLPLGAQDPDAFARTDLYTRLSTSIDDYKGATEV
jgi:hypothetical protein